MIIVLEFWHLPTLKWVTITFSKIRLLKNLNLLPLVEEEEVVVVVVV